MNKIKYFRLLILSIVLIFIIWLVYKWIVDDYTWEKLWSIASDTNIYAVFIIVGLFLVKTIFWIIPTKVLFIGASILFPAKYAILIVYLGLVLEFTVNYFVGKSLGQKKVMSIIRKSKHARWLIKKTEEHNFFSCFIVRLFPGPPIDVTNMFFASVGIKYIYYLFFSLLGLTPYIIVIIFMGGAIDNKNYSRFILFLAAYILVTVVFMLIKRKRKKKRVMPKEEVSKSA